MAHHSVDESAQLNESSSINSKDFKSQPHYFVIIDAGSSGSRVYIYEWKRPVYSSSWLQGMFKDDQMSYAFQDYLPLLVEHESFKIKPGISSFAHDSEGLEHHLESLLNFAVSKVPKEYRSAAPIVLFATAGMRLLQKDEQRSIIDKVCAEFKDSDFLFKSCKGQVRVISGEEEGIFGWLAVNYMTKSFTGEPVSTKNSIERSSTFGFLDMGGASAQLAFEPDREVQEKHLNDLTSVVLNSADSRSYRYNLYSRTFLGYGANEARRRYYEHLSGKQKNSAVIADPCSHKDLKFEEELGDKKASFVGTGDLEQCKKSLLPILNETAPCDDYPCFFDGVHAPEKDLSMERWIAVSEYWYTTNTFDLGGPYQYDKILKATKDFCESPWDAAKKLLEEDDEYRLRTQCFKMAWVMTMLHEGFDLPLHPDPSTGKHPVDSKDDISKVSISWTLGAVLLQLTQEQAFVKDSKASYVKQLVHTWNNPIIPFESDADNSQPPYIDDDSSDISSILFFLFVVVALTSILLAYYLYKQDGFNSLRVMCCGRTNGVQAWLSHRNRFMPVTVTERDIEMGGNFRVSSMSNASSSPMASASSILPSIAAAANVTQTRFPVRPQSTVPHTAASSTALLGTMK